MHDTPFVGHKKDELTNQQEIFCLEYLKDMNATQAAIRAKYSEKTANEQGPRLMTLPKVKKRVEALMKKIEKKLELSAEKVLKDIEECRVRCMQAEPVLDRDGNATGEWKFEANAALKASELQGKHLKLFTDKVEHSGTVRFDNVSDEDLDRKIKELIKGAK